MAHLTIQGESCRYVLRGSIVICFMARETFTDSLNEIPLVAVRTLYDLIVFPIQDKPCSCVIEH